MAYKSISDQRAACSSHYQRNKAAYMRRAKAHDAKTQAQVRAYVTGYLSGHPCLDCGEADRIVLEFDHRDRKLKKFAIGDAPSHRYSLRRVTAEIEKCDVRCANCHRRKTHKERQQDKLMK